MSSTEPEAIISPKKSNESLINVFVKYNNELASNSKLKTKFEKKKEKIASGTQNLKTVPS